MRFFILPMPLFSMIAYHYTVCVHVRIHLTTIYKLMNNLEKTYRKDLIMKRKGEITQEKIGDT